MSYEHDIGCDCRARSDDSLPSVRTIDLLYPNIDVVIPKYQLEPPIDADGTNVIDEIIHRIGEKP